MSDERTSGGTGLRVSVEPTPRADDTDVVLRGLRDFNDAHVGGMPRVTIGVFVRDAGHPGRVRGGLTGVVKFGWLYVDMLWLPAELRGTGLGTRVMDAAEEDARRRGCIGAHLETTDYQALPFYERRGYTVFGVLEDYPVGSRTYYLRKAL